MLEQLWDNSAECIANCRTEVSLCRIGEHLLPITKNEAEYDNSYVCSPYGGAVTYPLFELRELPSPTLRLALRGLISSVAPILRWGQINRVLIVNNFLLSTNLYPDWKGEGIKELLRQLSERFPTHAILFRSLNRATNPDLCDNLLEAGVSLAASRQTYIFATPEVYLRRSNSRQDLRIVDRGKLYHVVGPDEITYKDIQRIKELYDFLYLKKYTYLNPQFSAQLLETWRQSGFLKYFGLRNESGRLDGVVGCFQRAGINSAPVVGYDTTIPHNVGLYRMLMALVLRESAQSSMILNLSSGAAEFKRLRGGQPSVEYTGVYSQHLPRRQRLVWNLLASLLNRVGVPLLRKFEL